MTSFILNFKQAIEERGFYNAVESESVTETLLTMEEIKLFRNTLDNHHNTYAYQQNFEESKTKDIASLNLSQVYKTATKQNDAEGKTLFDKIVPLQNATEETESVD